MHRPEIHLDIPYIVSDIICCLMYRLGLLFWSHYRDDTVSQANLDGSDPITIASDVDTPSKRYSTPNTIAIVYMCRVSWV